jgi:hypothetical protein
MVLVAAAVVTVALLAALPVSAQAPWGSENWYVYEPIGIQAAAMTLRMSTDDLSDEIWAGKTLAELSLEAGVPLRNLRNAVDAEYFRWEHGFVSGDPDGVSVTVPIAAECRKLGEQCGFEGCTKTEVYVVEAPAKTYMRVTAKGGLRVRYGPGTGHGIFAVAPCGTVMETTGSVQSVGCMQWVEVIYSGRLMWAASSYLVPA